MTIRSRLTIAGVLLALMLGFGYDVYVKIKTSSADDSVRNTLRNLYVLAEEHFDEHDVTSVNLAQLDPNKLYHLGIRDPLDEAYPETIRKGEVLEASSFDGRRVVRFSP